MLHRQTDIRLGGVAALPLDGEEALVADLVQSGEVGVEVDVALTQRHLGEILDALELLGHGMDHAVDVLGVAAVEHDAVLGVGVDDVVLQVMDSRHGIVPRDHDQVGGVEVHAHALGAAQGVQELFEVGRGLGTRLHGEAGAHRVGVLGQLITGVLHDLVAVMVGILRHHADVGGDDAALQGEGQVHDALGLLDEGGVQLGVAEAVAQVAAEGGEDQAVGFEHTHELGALGGSHVLGGHASATLST